MPIAASDIVLRYSVPSAPSGGSTPGSGNGSSLGRWCSTTAIPDAVLDNLFPDLTGDENAAHNVDYQCVFVHNSNSVLTLLSPVLWLVTTGSASTTKAVAVDNTPATSYQTIASWQAVLIADKNTAPVGVGAFSSPTSKPTGILLGDIPPLCVKAVWVRRTATGSAATNFDSVKIRVEGDTLG